MKHKTIKLLSILLALALVLGIAPAMSLTAQAAGNGKAIQLVDHSGTTSVAANIEGGKGGSAEGGIWFGTYPQAELNDVSGLTEGVDYISANGKNYSIDPIKWRVLSTNGNGGSYSDGKSNVDGSKALFLVSDKLLGTGEYGEVFFEKKIHQHDPGKWYKGGYDVTDHAECVKAQVYQGSDAQGWCSGFYNGNLTENLTEQEQKAILATTKTDSGFTSSTFGMPFAVSEKILDGDKVFFLSAEEAEKAAYGFPNDDARIADYGNDAGGWWLRSPGANNDATNNAGVVKANGSVSYSTMDTGWAARPALNLNLESVLFTSAAAGGKAGPTGKLSEIGAYNRNDWKLTLKDESRQFEVTDKSPVSGEPGDTLTFAYTDATVKTGEAPNEWISAILTDEDGNALYYGRLTQPESEDSGENPVELTIPDGLAAGTYTIRLFSEQYNGDYKTDYAGEFQDVKLMVNVHSVTITPGKNMTKTSGAETQAVPYGEDMDDVVYKADEDYYFPENYSVVTENGVEVTRDSFTQITVSGTPTADVAITLTAPRKKEKEPTPNATFTATGYDTGTLSNMAAGMQYSLNGGMDWKSTTPTFETGASVDLTEVSPGTILVVKVGGGATVHSDIQTIEITRATPPDLAVTQPSTIGGTGSVATTAAHEFSTDEVNWTACTGETTGLAPGRHYVRVKPDGTVLASASQSIEITAATVTVTFDASGGKVNDLDTDTATTDTDGKLASLPTPTRSGSYRFDGWYTEKTGGEKVDTDTVFTQESTTIYARWTYTGSGGGGVSTYAITLEKPENGSLTASRNTAASGTKITVTSTPCEGFETDTVKVTDRSGKEISVTKNDDGTYTFTMPGSNVNVTATFKAKNPNTGTHDCPSAHLKDVDENAWYHEYIDYVVEKGLMQGMADDLFSPNVTTSRAMIVTILYRLEGRPAVSGASPFADVASGQWYTDAIIWAKSKGIVEGYGNGKFGSNDLITREQFAAIMYRYANFKGYDTSVGQDTNILSYDDAFEVSDWAMEAMQWAVGSGLITGRTETTLVPKGDATRAEAAAILMRYIENAK